MTLRRKEKPYSFFVERVQSMDHYKVRLCVLTRDGAGFYEVSPPVRVDHWSGIADGFLRIMIEAEPHLKGRKLPDITSGNTEKIDQNTWKDFTLEERLFDNYEIATPSSPRSGKSPHFYTFFPDRNR